jgi:Protein of unknown function (DUF3618)
VLVSEPSQTTSQTPAQIEADIEATRARLAGTVDELATRVQPKEIARRSAEDAKAKLQAATHTPDGSLRTERVAAVGAAAALVAALAGFRALRRRRS